MSFPASFSSLVPGKAGAAGARRPGGNPGRGRGLPRNLPELSRPPARGRGLFGAVLALALAAGPALSESVCHYGNPGTTVSIAPGAEVFAVVSIHNALAFRARDTCVLRLFGVAVTVVYDPGAGALPDWFHVAVPPGFVAIPPSILIEDGRSDRVVIVLDAGLGS